MELEVLGNWWQGATAAFWIVQTTHNAARRIDGLKGRRRPPWRHLWLWFAGAPALAGILWGQCAPALLAAFS
jgi:hypothetical protein